MYERTCVEIYGVGVEFSTPQENVDAVRCSGEFVVVCKADPTLALQLMGILTSPTEQLTRKRKREDDDGDR